MFRAIVVRFHRHFRNVIVFFRHVNTVFSTNGGFRFQTHRRVFRSDDGHVLQRLTVGGVFTFTRCPTTIFDRGNGFVDGFERRESRLVVLVPTNSCGTGSLYFRLLVLDRGPLAIVNFLVTWRDAVRICHGWFGTRRLFSVTIYILMSNLTATFTAVTTEVADTDAADVTLHGPWYSPE